MNCAVLVPVYSPNLTPDERASLCHLFHHLSGFSIFVIHPRGLVVSLPGVQVLEFDPQHFASVSAYSKLLLSPTFYENFTAFDYILIHQIDCLVFSPDLLRFCKMGYDYLGAPLFEKGSQPPRISRVGNGGLSLRRVSAFLDVLKSDQIPSWRKDLTASLPDLYKFLPAARWLKKIRIIRAARRGVRWYTQEYGLNEDLFWSDRARLFDPNFNIAPIEVALQFAFDAHPRTCFALNGQTLPFGAHAWAKWDRAFWEPYLLN